MTLKFTLQKLPHMPARFLKRVRNHGLAGTAAWIWYQFAWRWREWRLGINTAEHAFGLDVYGVGGGQYYDPIDHRCCDIVLDYLAPDPRRDVFFDYGAGLGRPLILAAQRPFRRVLGVENNGQLVALGRRQVENARSRGRFVCDAEIVQADAASYPLPHDVNRVLMYNAFVSAELLGTVLEQIRRSLAERPRDLLLVYIPLNSHGNQVEGCPWLRLRRELPAGFWDHVRVYVYEALLDQVGDSPTDPGPFQNGRRIARDEALNPEFAHASRS